MKKILFVIGTRPEAIKIAPLILEMKKQKAYFEIKVCLTAQHRQMLDQVLTFFDIVADYDLNLMKPNQNLHTLTADIIVELKKIYEDFKPHWVIVHGDTTTSTSAALSSFYSGINVAHVEAGLRTYNYQSPFPEEMNRCLTSKLASLHFSPTKTSKDNLIKENISEKYVYVTGNTVIDALKLGLQKINEIENEEIKYLKSILDFNKRIILVTGHRRENFGNGFEQICEALKDLANENTSSVEIVYPVHLNPNVQDPVNKLLSQIPNIKLVKPLGYESFIWMMNNSFMIITDSGGIQEEAPSLGKPVLVLRNTTERPEAVEAGTVVLVGTEKEKIIEEAKKLLVDDYYYLNMSNKHNPYGDGYATQRIIAALKGEKVQEFL